MLVKIGVRRKNGKKQWKTRKNETGNIEVQTIYRNNLQTKNLLQMSLCLYCIYLKKNLSKQYSLHIS